MCDFAKAANSNLSSVLCKKLSSSLLLVDKMRPIGLVWFRLFIYFFLSLSLYMVLVLGFIFSGFMGPVYAFRWTPHVHIRRKWVPIAICVCRAVGWFIDDFQNCCCLFILCSQTNFMHYRFLLFSFMSPGHHCRMRPHRSDDVQHTFTNLLVCE